VNILTIVGGGLAGCEAAWQAAELGIQVHLYEMRPLVMTPAHSGANLAELVCSNSFGSNLPDRASGLLKQELRLLGSKLLNCAENTALPAGGALAVDREAFSALVTEELVKHPNIQVIREEVKQIPLTPTIIASGPLTSPALSIEIRKICGFDHLYFYDAIAPIVNCESINMDIAFRASRYGRGEDDGGDYINCPFDKEQYIKFVAELSRAERIELRSFEEEINHGINSSSKTFFEGCLPVEVIALRGEKALAYGPMRPVGLIDPHTGHRPYAVLQLRQDNIAGSLYNLVGFQTNLKYTEQARVFRMIPGLENAEFIRYGEMHRNTYIQSPQLLDPDLKFKTRENLFFAGQITGVEGYMGNIGTGLLAGINAARLIKRVKPIQLPETTMLGALCHYISYADSDNFQPMKANFGILPPLNIDQKLNKRQRAGYYVQRSIDDLTSFIGKKV
jgi:methylenetetrahydrofolate--tRNA-(uracil-5-)-methyltransferase